MNELGVLAAGAGSKVPLLDQGHLHTTKRKIAGDACAIDSTAQDQDIKRFTAQTFEIAGASVAGKCRLDHSIASLKRKSWKPGGGKPALRTAVAIWAQWRIS